VIFIYVVPKKQIEYSFRLISRLKFCPPNIVGLRDTKVKEMRPAVDSIESLRGKSQKEETDNRNKRFSDG
jgi:hypothetical protein